MEYPRHTALLDEIPKGIRQKNQPDDFGNYIFLRTLKSDHETIEEFAGYIIKSEHWGGQAAGVAGGGAQIVAHNIVVRGPTVWYRFVTEVKQSGSNSGTVYWHQGNKGVAYKGTKINDQELEVDYYGFNTIVIKISNSLKKIIPKEKIDIINKNHKDFIESLKGQTK